MRLTGTLTVPLPPSRAFRLFTARGEQDWVKGWEPRFPVPVEDDTVPGTVFETDADGVTTTWVVTAREEHSRISYARVTPGHRAGTVTVALARDGDGDGSEVTVTYDLTPFDDEAARELAEFARGYTAFLRSWQDDIEAFLRAV
ncbi:SRPBCC family protein [Streptosporangium sp. NPDC004379]|uniref:SRPBCC family protein n=1 Tax=Streptosporangium sp. NPDC004379 TaxID=3366189 RepID=UPI00369877D3